MKEKLKQKIYPIYEKEIFSPLHGWPTKFRIIQLYIRLKLRYYKNKLKYGKAAPNPFEILWINPEKIQKFSAKEYRPPKKRFKQLGTVKGGDWDINTFEKLSKASRENDEYQRYKIYHKNVISNTIFFTSLKKVLINCNNWEETEYWSFLKSKYHESLPAKKKTKKIEKAYHKIDDEGFTAAKNINNKKFSFNHFDDIIVDISRKGEFLLRDGRHRIAVAKLLDADKVPVRIATRHFKWQKKRLEAKKNNSNTVKDYEPHPDISISN